MTTTEILIAVNEICRDVFDQPSLEITESTTAGDVEEWDSLTHIQLIVSVEKRFKVKFTSAEIARFKTVGDLCSSVSSKLS
jgi:acyl carrier protein